MIKLVEIIALREMLATARSNATGKKARLLWDATDALCDASQWANRGRQDLVRYHIQAALGFIRAARIAA